MRLARGTAELVVADRAGNDYTGRAELSAPCASARRQLKVKLDGPVAQEWTITSESGQTPAVTTASVGSMAARWFLRLERGGRRVRDGDAQLRARLLRRDAGPRGDRPGVAVAHRSVGFARARGWSPVLTSNRGLGPLHLIAGAQDGNPPVAGCFGPPNCQAVRGRVRCIETSKSAARRSNAPFTGPALRLCCSRMPAAAPVILRTWRACSLPVDCKPSVSTCAVLERAAARSTA